MNRTEAKRIFSVVVVLLASQCALADVGGKITGTVKDQTDAAIDGVTVMVVNAATGAKQTTKTDAQGMYSFPVLSVGQYELDVAADGFRPYRRTGLAVDVNSALVVDVALQVAERNESVTVTEASDAVQVEKADTQMGQTINEKRITEVPLNGRSYTDLLAIQAGVNPATTNVNTSSGGAGGFGSIDPSGGLNPGNFSINGERESANGFILNGANVEEAMAGAAAVVPNLDSIAEFRVLTSNFDAEYGEYAGGLVSTVTKSGTDQIHGSLFEFLRNTDLDARGFFDPTRPQYNQNQYGGTLGGPIKKDRIFFFADFQGSRAVQGQETGFIPVPTLQDRSGNLIAQTQGSQPSVFENCPQVKGGVGPCTVSGSNFANILSQRLGYQVAAGENYYVPGCLSTGPSPCVFPGAVIPKSAWSAPALNLLQYVPQPNVGNSTFSSATMVEPLNDAKGAIRLDANTSDSNLSAYYHLDNYNLNNPYPTPQGGANVPGFNALSNGQTQLVTFADTKTIGASKVNEFRLSYLRAVNDLGQASGGVGPTLASQGFVPASEGGIVPGSASTLGIETVAFNSLTFGTTPFAVDQVNQNYELQDNFSQVRGNHTLKFGFQGHIDHIKQNVNLIENGEFQFTGTETGLDFADFLIGRPNAYLQSYTPQFDNRSRYAGLFAQDSWRVRPHVTLNYGLRWEWIPAWALQKNQTATFIPGDQSLLFPGAPAGYIFPGDNLPDGSTVPSTIAPTRKDDFSPRMGIAYSPSPDSGLLHAITGGPGNSSVRAGYGRFFTAIEGLTTSYQTGNPPYGLQYSSPERPLFEAPFVGALDGAVVPQPFPLGVPPTNASRQNPDTNVNWSLFTPLSGAVGYYYKNPTPYSENYFLSFERQVGASTVVTASYIGTQGHHLLTLLSANSSNPALCLSVSQTSRVAPGSAVCGPFAETGTFTTASGGAVVPRQPLGSNFGSDAYFYGYGNSTYNSLQLVAKHGSKRLSLLATYTYGKSIDMGSNIQEQLYPFDYRRWRNISAFDLRQNFVASYRYELPFEKLFGNNRAAAGWALTGITRFSTGVPVTLIDLNDYSLLGTNNQGVNGGGADMPNFMPGDLEINHDPRNGQPYFNASLFSIAPLGSPGTSPRRFFYGPGQDNWDMALLKVTHLSESKVLEMRLETFNTFNHAQFFGPTSVNANISSLSFGQVVSAMPNRVMQVAAKFSF
jgi:Carboxypeptidase regulatory-like domain/TonB dependent receptor